jgi:hypothetical protein
MAFNHLVVTEYSSSKVAIHATRFLFFDLPHDDGFSGVMKTDICWGEVHVTQQFFVADGSRSLVGVSCGHNMLQNLQLSSRLVPA